MRLLAALVLASGGVLGAQACASLDGLADGSPGPSPQQDGAAPPAAAVGVSYGLGDGHRGPQTVGAGQTAIVNSYAALSEPAQAASTLAFERLRGDAFAPGDLVLVWQTATNAQLTTSETIDLASTNVGQWELARVIGVNVVPNADAGDGGQLTLDHPIGAQRGFTVPGAQVVRVPEFTDVTIQASGSIATSRWDGFSGGIAAMYVKGTLRNDGTVNADGAGFRGGQGSALLPALTGCAATDGSLSAGYARKGEGFALGAFGDAGGLANVANGGGGGNCSRAGGGGGGNGGQGGRGGFSGDGDRDVGGRGGAALVYPSLLERLTLGGGGGAGESDGASLPVYSSGGAGGGSVLVRAREITGSGRISARGWSGTAPKADVCGAGGGGAGGSALVQVVETLACGQVSVRGGAGASLGPPLFTASASAGPGGGGAGGRALVQGRSTPCSVENRAGTAGVTQADGGTRGSTPDVGAEVSPPHTLAPVIVPEPYCDTCP